MFRMQCHNSTNTTSLNARTLNCSMTSSLMSVSLQQDLTVFRSSWRRQQRMLSADVDFPQIVSYRRCRRQRCRGQTTWSDLCCRYFRSTDCQRRSLEVAASYDDVYSATNRRRRWGSIENFRKRCLRMRQPTNEMHTCEIKQQNCYTGQYG